MTKIYIIGHNNIDTYAVGLKLQELNDGLSVSSKFTTNPNNINEYHYYLDKETVNISYKNNSLITVVTNDNESIGITYDDYYNNDIFCMSLVEFNMLPDKILKEENLENITNLVVWVDSSDNVDKSDIEEASYVEARLENLTYLYFCNEQYDQIAEILYKFLRADDFEQQQILEEYS